MISLARFCSFDNLSNLEVNKTEKSFISAENNAYFRQGHNAAGD